MHALFRPLTDAFLLVQVIGVGTCLLLFVVEGSYFFGRALLKITGLHSASQEQFRSEMKLLKISAVIFVLALVCATVAGFLGGLGGITD